MNIRENFKAVLRYQSYEKLPIIDFGWWGDTVKRWHREGMPESVDGNAATEYLGFDRWYDMIYLNRGLLPGFEEKVVETRADGSWVYRSSNGTLVHNSPDNTSIPEMIGWTLRDRASWEKEYQWRLNPADPRRLPAPEEIDRVAASNETRTSPLGLHIGSLYGTPRDLIGFEGISMMLYDDPELIEEIIENQCQLVEKAALMWLERVRFDYAHFWEDIAFRNGPMISPAMFRRFVVPRYKRLTEICHQHGVDIIMVDCDGCIDDLVPCWLEAGVNCMFPIEVGTWGANIARWRERYGKAVIGVGGVEKFKLSLDRTAIDAEVERLKPLVELGGYIPCPDHRIPPNVPLDNMRYYVEKMRAAFG